MDINIDPTPPTPELPPDQILPQADPGGTEVKFYAVVRDDISGANDQPFKSQGDCIQYANTRK